MIYFQVISTCSMYLFLAFGNYTEYSSYKLVDDNLIVTNSSTHIILTVFMGIVLLEILIICLSAALLHQERKLTLWSCDDWQIRILNIGIKFALACSYTINCVDKSNLVFSIITACLFFGQIILRFLSPLYWKRSFDLFALGFDIFIFIIACMILIDSFYDGYSLFDNYQYSGMVPIFCIILFFIKCNLYSDRMPQIIAN